jgi:hypothetical protein
MIVIKPKLNTVFSLVIFISIMIVLSAFMGWQYYMSKRPEYYQFLIMVFSGTFGIALLIKFLWNWKKLEVGKGKFQVDYTFRFKKNTLSGKDLNFWREEVVKTWGGSYSEIDLFFNEKKKVNLSLQEHDGYIKLRQYLEKNYGKLKRNR